MKHNNNSTDLLNIRRQEVAELNRLERARRELPALEKEEARRSQQASARQDEQRFADRLAALVDDYKQALEVSNKEVRELVRYVDDLRQRRASLDATGSQVSRMAEQVAKARLRQNRGAAGAGVTGNFSQDSMALQATTEAVLNELDCKIGAISITRRTGAIDDLVLAMLARLGCKIRMAESKPPLPRKFPIVDSRGRTTWR